MSQSLRPLNAPGASPAGAPSDLPADSPPSTGDIADEINDHLACRRTELEDKGVDPSAAEQQARRSFGDAGRIARQLFWIHHGERIMSQRLLWAAIALVFAALIANMFMQQRSAAAMNAAIVKLAEQLGRNQQPMGEALIKVVDENGKPRAGVNVSVGGMNPSPYLSNATYSRKFESDADGLVRTGPIPLGTYQASAVVFHNGPNRSMIGISGPGFSLFDNGRSEEATLTAPAMSIARVTIESPEVAGWTMTKAVRFDTTQRFGATTVTVSGSAALGQAVEIPMLPTADIELSYQLGNRDRQKAEHTFEATQSLPRTDPVLVSGGTIQLGLPSNRTSTLTADGKVLLRHAASHKAGE